ncbi:MAG: prolyl oligopeptidase family serine peptidase [Bacteroidota bacterium]|nr:prolyl oligopeptidase family serine peptidase [Bacteroidota bacterium]
MKSLVFIVICVTMGLSTVFGQKATNYQFTEGLYLNSSVLYDRTCIISDPVMSALFLGQLSPQEGKEFKFNFDNHTQTWKKLIANEKGVFIFPENATGHLYLSYNSDKEKIVWFQSIGNTMSVINGLPHEGDHYSFGWTQIPVKLKKGLNEFILTSGRGPTMSAKIIDEIKPIALVTEDMTLPDQILGEEDFCWGSIRIINSTEKQINGLLLECTTPSGSILINKVASIGAFSTMKAPFKIPHTDALEEQQLDCTLILMNKVGKIIDKIQIPISLKNKSRHHSRTFISEIDRSVQYYSVCPGHIPDSIKPAMFLSVHGASVEARGQAAAYMPKSWGHVVAATNRRPYGFGWEDWGRLDALEVLNVSEKLYGTDPQRTYLTGHSMGGHGTWSLGANYPDRFAALAPCSGYPDMLNYANSKAQDQKTEAEKMMLRANNASRTVALSRNYLHNGIYILHGDSDETVPVALAQSMRQLLATFHPDFCYYEYPGGKHWFGNQSVDWPRIFDFFKYHTIPNPKDVRNIDFTTASPGVSSSSNWIEIYQQEHSYSFSSVKFSFDPDHATIKGQTQNVSFLIIKKLILNGKPQLILDIDNQKLEINTQDKDLLLKKEVNRQWTVATALPSFKEKNPLRYGSFKDAFRHNMIFVYASKGSEKENEWYYNKARFDAETFLYRGNASVQLIKDTEFDLKKYPDCGVILYGNASNNAAWSKLLANCPLQVKNNDILFGNKHYSGSDLGCYFTWPRSDSNYASVGVIAGTGEKGMKACYANQYFLSGTGFPDVTIFNSGAVINTYQDVLCTGFFGNDWSIAKGDFYQK